MLAHYASVPLIGAPDTEPQSVLSGVAAKQPTPSPALTKSKSLNASSGGQQQQPQPQYDTLTGLNCDNNASKPTQGSCSHLAQLRRSKGSDYLLEQYSIIVQHFVACCSAPDRRRRAYSAVCGVCRERNRLHVCLLCVHLACHSPTRSHILAHSAATDHHMAVELSYGQLFCADCKDYIYDSAFSAILLQFNNRARLDLGLPAIAPTWEPNEEEMELLRQNPKRRKLSSHLTIGLRGLLNLGSTCFMNSILQALVHTPFIRDYFLSEQHRCVSQEGGGSQTCCLGCEVAATFREFYSGMQQPYIPYRLLHIVWKHAKHLAGYEQQDAHEFLISLLDILHTHLIRANNVGSNNNNSQSSASSTSSSLSSSPQNQCSCIIHKVFTGYLQSDVVCHKCNSARTTIDPFWDISLDLITSSTSPSPHGLSLRDCIQRFTKPENLTGAKIECTVCRTFEEDLWSKQLTFKQLPLVVCFHLKRFSGSANGSHRKISDMVSFPVDLDLTPFTTQARATTTQRSVNNNNTEPGSEPPTAKEILLSNANSYALFGVVSHTGGQIDNGHYVAYVRQNKDWFKCDDHLVTPVRVADVLSAEGYLLFYHKKFVDYTMAPLPQPLQQPGAGNSSSSSSGGGGGAQL